MSERRMSPRAEKMFAVIEAYLTSGQTQKAFCESEAVALATFQYWLARYKRHHRIG